MLRLKTGLWSPRPRPLRNNVIYFCILQRCHINLRYNPTWKSRLVSQMPATTISQRTTYMRVSHNTQPCAQIAPAKCPCTGPSLQNQCEEVHVEIQVLYNHDQKSSVARQDRQPTSQARIDKQAPLIDVDRDSREWTFSSCMDNMAIDIRNHDCIHQNSNHHHQHHRT